jgi:uncharacterized membrane protein YfcA
MALKISELPTLTTITDDDYIPFTDVTTLVTSKITYENFLASFISSSSWTPALTFATPGDLAVSYSTREGTYVKTGDLVTVWFNILTSAFTHTTASGHLRITGLPFTAASGITYFAGSAAISGITQANYTQWTPIVQNGTAYVVFLSTGQGQSESSVGTDVATTGSTLLIRGSLTYKAV